MRYLSHPANTSGISLRSDASSSSDAIYAFIVSPKRIASFCDVSVAIRCGVSGMNGFGSLTSSTVFMNFFGSRIPGFTTTGSPSL